jgi:hypothetical protein
LSGQGPDTKAVDVDTADDAAGDAAGDAADGVEGAARFRSCSASVSGCTSWNEPSVMSSSAGYDLSSTQTLVRAGWTPFTLMSTG